MSPLGKEMERQMAEAGINVSELARRMGKNVGAVSRYVRGRNLTLHVDTLTEIAQHLSPDPKKHAALVRAHLENHLYGPGSERIEIVVRGSQKKAERAKVEQAADFLIERCRRTEGLRDLIYTLAKLAGWEPKEEKAGRKDAGE